MEVRVSQVKPSNCFRRLDKLVLPSIFDTSLSSLMMWNLRSYPTTVLNEAMWHSIITHSDPSCVFSWSPDPQTSRISPPQWQHYGKMRLHCRISVHPHGSPATFVSTQLTANAVDLVQEQATHHQKTIHAWTSTFAITGIAHCTSWCRNLTVPSAVVLRRRSHCCLSNPRR